MVPFDLFPSGSLACAVHKRLLSLRFVILLKELGDSAEPSSWGDLPPRLHQAPFKEGFYILLNVFCFIAALIVSVFY